MEGGRFKTCVALVICLNAIFIGVASELSMQLAIDGYELQQGDPSGVSDLPAWIDAGDVLFNVFFTLELLLRILCLDYRFFTKDWFDHLGRGADGWGWWGGGLRYWGEGA